MQPFTLHWAADAMAATMSAECDGLVSSVATDTRHLTPGSLFFALKGETTDGHRFVETAFRAGAVAAVVSRHTDAVPGCALYVDDTLRSFGDLAGAYRSQFHTRVVAVTGSVGKTTTKEMLAVALRGCTGVLVSEHNFNNEIGVPITLFRLGLEHSVAVVEMGMRGRGQIARLCEIARPTLGVITRIGYAHIEMLGSRHAIAEAKAELIASLPEGGTAVLPADDMYFELLRDRAPDGVKIVTFGTGKALVPPDVLVSRLPSGSASVTYQGLTTEFALRATGSHLLENAGAALATCCALDVPLELAAAALETWEGAAGRMTVRTAASGALVLDDCYNAGPESMEAALATLAEQRGRTRVAVLGDMKELGAWALEAHASVGRVAAASGLRLLITIGELANGIATAADSQSAELGIDAPMHLHFESSRAAERELVGLIGADDVVLVKGSRSMGMEVIVAALTGDMETYGHG